MLIFSRSQAEDFDNLMEMFDKEEFISYILKLEFKEENPSLKCFSNVKLIETVFSGYKVVKTKEEHAFDIYGKYVRQAEKEKYNGKFPYSENVAKDILEVINLLVK